MTTEGVWEFELESNSNLIKSLGYQLGNLDIIIWEEEIMPDTDMPIYFFASPHLADLDSVQEVVDRATALKAIFDGALLIDRGLRAPYSQLGKLRNPQGIVEDSYSKGNILADPFRSDTAHWLYPSPTTGNPFHYFLSQAVFLSRYDTSIKDILLFLGFNGISWISLYAIRDFLHKFEWSDRRISVETGFSEREISRFTHTANNFQAIGPYARHGATKTDPPKNPMKIEEAADIMLLAAKVYINSKAREFKTSNNIT